MKTICDNCKEKFQKLECNVAISKHNFCSRSCYYEYQRTFGMLSKEGIESLRQSKLGERNPNWKGDRATQNSGNDRARNWYRNSFPCEMCGSEQSERHHKDGNSLNNSYDNIMWVCRRHHMEIDGRLVDGKVVGFDNQERYGDSIPFGGE